MRKHKIPLRKCIVTHEQHPKMEMFRIVRTPENTIVIDSTGKVRGHGAYLSKNKDVILKAKKKKVLDIHLETSVPEKIYDDLLELLSNS